MEGYAPKSNESMNSNMDHIGPRYFSTLGIPLLMGREIEPQDSGSGLRAAVINQTFAKRFFPNTNPIGKHVRDTYPANPGDVEVVGVVSDIKVDSLREKTRPRIYAPLFNPLWEETAAVYEVRTFADPAGVSDLLRQAVQTTSATIPPIEIKTMSGLVDQSLQTDRFIEWLSETFGLLAMLLASVGLYGIMAYTVARRSREIGIRMALGAEPGNIGRQVLAETLVLACIGIGIGLPIALLGTRFGAQPSVWTRVRRSRGDAGGGNGAGCDCDAGGGSAGTSGVSRGPDHRTAVRVKPGGRGPAWLASQLTYDQSLTQSPEFTFGASIVHLACIVISLCFVQSAACHSAIFIAKDAATQPSRCGFWEERCRR